MRDIFMNGFLTAVKTLTAIPLPGEDRTNFSGALPWFPVVGAGIGFIIWGLAVLWTVLPLETWPSGGAFFLICCEVWITRGLHLDGLADWADSIGAGKDRQKRLWIMKDVHMGAFGVVAIVLALLARFIAYVRILEVGSLIWVICVFALSRGLLVGLITGLSYAREGEGMGRPFVLGASPIHGVLAHMLCMVIALAYGPAGIMAYCVGFVLLKIMKARFNKSFGGITGDLLGTACETIQVCLLLIIAIAGTTLPPYTGWRWIASW